jgi:hypothetical protein
MTALPGLRPPDRRGTRMPKHPPSSFGNIIVVLNDAQPNKRVVLNAGPPHGSCTGGKTGDPLGRPYDITLGFGDAGGMSALPVLPFPVLPFPVPRSPVPRSPVPPFPRSPFPRSPVLPFPVLGWLILVDQPPMTNGNPPCPAIAGSDLLQRTEVSPPVPLDF